MTDTGPVDELLDKLLGFARTMLDDHGEFFPFAGVVSTTGTIEVLVADTEEERPPAESVVELLYAGLVEKAVAGEISACALCVNVTISTEATGNTDAVQVSVESDVAEPLDVYLPYTLTGTEVTYGQPLGAEGERRAFV